MFTTIFSGCSIREINLTDYKHPAPKNVSYLLVDKDVDDQAQAMIFMRWIDDTALDLVMDPCVYIIRQGNHTLKFTANDFKDGNSDDTAHTLKVTFQPGKYYQVLPFRKNGLLTFEFTEIDPKKTGKIYRRQIKGLIGYLLSDG